MAIKKKTSRDTYRSNVKERPLRQNGLEAQHQGLDITEVNIDHGGLAIIGRGGHQTRRDIRKVRKQYIIDVPQEEHNPTAELVLLNSVVGSPFDHTSWDDGTTSLSTFSLQDLDGETFEVADQDGTSFVFRFTKTEAHTNGESIPASSDIAVNIFENNFSKRELMFAVTGSIETVFPEDTFRFEMYPSGSKQRQYGAPEPVTILEDKIVLILSSSVVGSALLTGTSTFLGDTNNFDDQSESHEWRLNGILKDNSDQRVFYEDLRTDTIQSTEPHSFRSSALLFRQAQFTGGDPAGASFDPRSNYDRNIGPYEYASNSYANGIAGDPTQLPRFTKHDSSEVLVRQFPKREEVFDTYRGNHQWREDIHYLSLDQQVWSRMEPLALNYHSSLEVHIGRMMDSNFADEQYIDAYPLSGRVDVFDRLSRTFDTNVDSILERHPNSVFDQYLDPLDDFVNLQQNRFPKADDLQNDIAFEDVRGRRSELAPDYDKGGEYWYGPSNPDPTTGLADGLPDYWAGQNSMMFIDYFDQPDLETHDHVEDERWSRIDSDMLEVLTFHQNRGTHIDRREWQETDYVYTATGFINSQQSGQDGIIYREMKR